MKRTFLPLLLILVLVVSMTGCGGETTDGIKMPFSSGVAKGQDYQELLTDLEKAGFTNIETEVLDDLLTGWITKDGEVEQVSVDGDAKYNADARYPVDVAIVVTYHTFPEKDKSEKSSSVEHSSEPDTESPEIVENVDKIILEGDFSMEKAKRAAVVAITNAYATDVFMPDGNNYDASKFHSYSDVSGDFMKVTDEGNWSVKDDHTWTVDGLLLKTTYGTIVTAKLNVSFDGTNYIVSNISGILGNDGASAENKVDISEIESGKNNPYLTVSPKLIEIDRDLNTDNVDSDSPDNTKWANSLFSSWDGSCSALNKIIKKQLNDEKSFKHIETTSIGISSEAIKKDVSEILTKANVTATIEIGDVIIITEFSAKNSLNATVKNTAYAIASQKTKDIELLAIV